MTYWYNTGKEDPRMEATPKIPGTPLAKAMILREELIQKYGLPVEEVRTLFAPLIHTLSKKEEVHA